MSTQAEPEWLDIGTIVMSTTHAFDSLMDEQKQTGVNGAKGQTNNQMSEHKINLTVTENIRRETNVQQQENIEENNVEFQFESVSLDGQDSKLVKPRINERITEIDEKIEKISGECDQVFEQWNK
jgi:hypothetical protein